MNLGIRLHDTTPGTLAQRAQEARAQGFACVHLALGKVLGAAWAQPAACTPQTAAMLAETLAPMRVAVLGCYLNLAHPDETAYQQMLAQYEAHLRLSRHFDGCVVGTETCNRNAAGAYDAAESHTEEALRFLINRLRPVVKAAEACGAVLAIEPVYTHIVSSPRIARKVLDQLRSPSLKIILDPVNLLHPDNLDRRDEVIGEALALLGQDTAVFHMKDYIWDGATMRVLAAGLGKMDYAPILRYIAKNRPDIPVTLENTTPQNAQAARLHLQTLYNALAKQA